jgi:hypothetical protein
MDGKVRGLSWNKPYTSRQEAATDSGQIKIQFILHIEHSVVTYERPTSECCEEKRPLSMVRIVLNT